MYDAGINFEPVSTPLPALDLAPAPAGAPALDAACHWPFPQHCTPGEDAQKMLGEFCELALSDERAITGSLVHFDTPARQVTVFSEQSLSLEKVGFDELISLRLTRRVVVECAHAETADGGDSTRTHPFTLTLKSGASVNGDTAGFAEDGAGLFLFLPDNDGALERRFYPHSAVKSREMGGLLGEYLLQTGRIKRSDLDAALAQQQASRSERLGDVLQKQQIITREVLAAALKRQESMPVVRLGEALLQLNYISEDQLNAALEQQRQDRKVPLGQILVNSGAIDEQHLKQALAEKMGIPFVDLDAFPLEFDASSRIKEEVARKFHAVPLYVENGTLVVALSDPLNAAQVETLRFQTQMRIAPVMATEAGIRKALDRSYGAAPTPEVWGTQAVSTKPDEPISFATNAEEKSKTEELLNQLSQSNAQKVEIEEPQVTESDNSLVKLVNKIMIDAMLQRATDIHIENHPGKLDTCVRFRRDGALYDYLQIPHRFRSAIVSRIKIMAALDISEKRRPQDGKLEFNIPGEPKIELRVATIPTANGLEDIVMRLLASATLRSLDAIGMDEAMVAQLQRLIAKPYGMMLVCGPTGSGKTTTLHSLLAQINTRERKIWTAEDPVEITHPGLRQVQVNTKIGWTFAATLRAFLRGDPDVIMVGEMRDLETARIGMEASLTGHLVLSTLHTNSAIDSVVRLLDMGLDPFNFADALLGIVAQRLARKVCETCGTREAATDEELVTLAEEYCADTEIAPASVIDQWRARHAGKEGKILLRRAQGCAECGNTGYRGRVGLYELFSLDRELKSLVQKRAPMEELLRLARAKGMTTLKQNGIDKIISGLTDLKQVRAVCG
jgi:type II secretory ATPase GspE/PulE/Tfp pilus assembly ATPase PilB-like protein